MKFRHVRNQTFIPSDDEMLQRAYKMGEGEEIEVAEVNQNPGSVNMLRTWRGWMGETATAMNHWGCTMPMFVDGKGIPHGKRPYNADDAHEHFTSLYLGHDEQGRRKSWTLSKKDPDRVQASIGDRLWAMDRHLEWCTEKGVKLTIPRQSEYWKLKEAQAQNAENLETEGVIFDDVMKREEVAA